MIHKDHTIVAQGRFIPHNLASTWDTMEWERKHMQEDLILKTNFDKSYDKANWSFIYWMLNCFGCVHRCDSIESTMFTKVSSFFRLIGSSLLRFVFIIWYSSHWVSSICGQIHGILLLNGYEMVYNRFQPHTLPLVKVENARFKGNLSC